MCSEDGTRSVQQPLSRLCCHSGGVLHRGVCSDVVHVVRSQCCENGSCSGVFHDGLQDSAGLVECCCCTFYRHRYRPASQLFCSVGFLKVFLIDFGMWVAATCCGSGFSGFQWLISQDSAVNGFIGQCSEWGSFVLPLCHSGKVLGRDALYDAVSVAFHNAGK